MIWITAYILLKRNEYKYWNTIVALILIGSLEISLYITTAMHFLIWSK